MPTLSYNAEQVRRYDRDRFLTCLFAPPDRREALFALLAFNHEIAKTREIVSEPIMGQMRLQWWRESLEPVFVASAGPVRRHAVLDVLAPAIREHALTAGLFEALLEAREQDLRDDPPETEAAFLAYAEGISVPLLHLMLEVLGVRDPTSRAAARAVGLAHAIAGLLAAVPIQARQGRVSVPEDLLRVQGLTPRTMIDGRTADLPPVVSRLADRAEEFLTEARRRRGQVPPQATPVLLTATLAESHLRRLRRNGYDPFRLAPSRTDPWQIPRLIGRAWRGRW